MFKFLSIKELSNHRLVCKDWNQEAIPYLRKLVKINFSCANIRNMVKFNQDLLITSRNLNNFPFCNFIITIWDKTDDFYDAGGGFYQTIPYQIDIFFKTFGSYIKWLKLSINEFEKIMEFNVLTKSFVNLLPNLEILELSALSSCGLENKQQQNYTWPNLYDSSFSKLTKLKLIDFFGEYDAKRKEEVAAAAGIAGEYHHNYHLDQQLRFNVNFIKSLLTLCSNIQELTIDTMECKMPCSLTQSILEVLTTTTNTNTMKNDDACIIGLIPRLTTLNLYTTINETELRNLIQNNNNLYLTLINVRFLQLLYNFSMSPKYYCKKNIVLKIKETIIN